MMKTDIKRCTFTYRDGFYFNQLRGIKHKIIRIHESKGRWYKFTGKKNFLKAL
jgi:hypothetical protein